VVALWSRQHEVLSAAEAPPEGGGSEKSRFSRSPRLQAGLCRRYAASVDHSSDQNAAPIDRRAQATRAAGGHIPVLLDEVLEWLSPRAGQTFLDCTAGLGGHAAAVARRVGPAGSGSGGTVVLNDMDGTNLARAEAVVRAAIGTVAVAEERTAHAASVSHAETTVVVYRGNFAEAPRRMIEAGLSADLVLADLGFSSNQIGDPARGFSFANDGPLDMRLDPTAPLTAADLVNSLPEGELAEIIAEFGEDPASAKIARKLVQERRREPITTTSRLADLVRSSRGPHHDRSAIDPATKTFQALRIAVNDELGSLDAFLAAVARGASEVNSGGAGAGGKRSWLSPGARVAVIGFHSLEDRRVKRTFIELQERGLAQVLTPTPITASEKELHANPRARSAKLRVIQITPSPKSGAGPV